MFVKYIELHNKILRDSANPEETAKELIANDYSIIAVAVHQEGKEVRDKEHFYKLFEDHFETFEKEGLLIVPFLEIKLSGDELEQFDELVEHFSKIYIPVNFKGKKYHLPFIMGVHGGVKEINEKAANNPKIELICHPEQGEWYFPKDLAQKAVENNVGLEINHREYRIAKNKEEHKNKLATMIHELSPTGIKFYISSAMLKEQSIIHINEVLEFANDLDKKLIEKSINNTLELIKEKYHHVLEVISLDVETIRKHIK